MKVAVLSDSHDNIWKLDQAMPYLAAADAIIHCGDLVAPFIVRQIAEGVGDTPVHIVWGNNDGDTFHIGKVAEGFPHLMLHGFKAAIELAAIAVAVCHYPHVAKDLALSGQYGMVCFGHSHRTHEEWINDCLLLNPGELMGRDGRSTIALVDLPQRSVEWIEL